MTTGLALDILIICLLAGSTGYFIVLNRRLGLLRQGQEEFFNLMGRFDDATQRAENNIDHLRGVGIELDENLGERITRARALRDELDFLIGRGTPAVDRNPKPHASRREAPIASGGLDSDSLVEANLLEALREARKG